MRLPSAGALVCALAVLAAAAPAEARPHAVIAFLPPGPGETRPLLEEFAARGMAIGLTSPTVGGFKVRQMGLDMSQGTRIPTRIYSGPIGVLRVQGGRLIGWALALRRADRAPGDLKPGLLASTIIAAGGRVGYAVRGGGYSIAPIVAATRGGGVTPRGPGDSLDVVQLAPGGAGLRDLDRLLAARGRDGFVYVVRAPYGTKLRLLPSAIAAPGIHGQLRSATTRQTGVIAATDVAPTVLRALGIRVPSDMQGEVIEGRGSADPHAVERLGGRLAVVTSRRVVTLFWLLAAWAVLVLVSRIALGSAGTRMAVRAGFLAALWAPGLALLTAALEPSRMAEAAIIGVGAVLLGVLTDRVAPWPGAPAIPAGTVFVAHAVDLARGSPLIARSMAGPNPAGGARFFGVGNELEAILCISLLIGTGAALAWRHETRRAPFAFAVVAIVAAAIMGAGRLGADVGAVVTLGAGGAAAVVASLSTRPSRRTIVLAITAPVVAVGLLILLDLATGGGAHLTRSVVHSHGSGGLGAIARRRVSGSLSPLLHPAWAITFALALSTIIWLATRGRRVLPRLPQPFRAGLVGAWFAGVAGALANDSGPLILVIAAILLLLAYFYAREAPAAPHQPF